MKNRKPRNIRPTRTLLTCALASCLMLSAAPTVFAQSSNAILRGHAPAGSQVTATNTQTGLTRRVATNADGSYALVGLPPGTYRVDAGAGTEQTVTLSVASSTSLDLQQAPATPGADATNLDAVVVTAPPLTEVKTSEVSKNVSLKTISTIPQVSRNFLEFADTVPGLQFTTNANGVSRLRGGAQTSSAINVYIDGVGQKDYVLAGGVTGQDQSTGSPFPQMAIGEFKVISSNYKAEFDQVGSAAIIAQTKSGTNEFHGEVFVKKTNTGWRAATVAEEAGGNGKKKTDQEEYGFALGGPIIQDKMHFFFSYEGKDFVTPSNPVGSPPQWANFDQYLPASVQAQLGPNTKPFSEDLAFGKINWDIGDNDRLEFSIKYRDEESRSNVGDRTTASADKINFNTDERYVLQWQHYGENYLNEARFTYEDALFNPAAYVLGNQSIYTRGPLENDVLVFSDSTSSLSIQRKGQKGPAFQDDITFSSLEWHGDHVIKAGFKYKQVELTQNENSVLNPSFRYAVNDGSLPVTPYSPIGTNPIPYQVNFNTASEGASPTVTTDSKQFGIYIQDDWNVTDKLQLNLGVRWDYEEIPSYLDYVTPDVYLEGLALPGTGPTPAPTYAEQLARGGIDINDYISTGNNRKADKNNFAPRLGFSYDIRGDESLVVFGGAGRSYDRNLYDYLGLEQVKAALSGQRINFVESSGCTPAPGSCVAWDPRYLNGIEELQGLALPGRRRGEPHFLNNDLVTPYSDQFSLGLRTRLGDWNTSATVTHVHSKEGLVFSLGNRYPDGSFFSAPSWNANDIAQPWEHPMPHPDGGSFGNMILGNNGIETKTSQLLLSAEKPYTAESGWGVTVAYTYSHAKGNRGADDHYIFDGATIADYPFINLDAVPKHRLVMTGIYDLPWNITASAKVTLATKPPMNSVVGWWEYGSTTAVPPLIVSVDDLPGTTGQRQLDLSLSKDLHVTENVTVQVRGDLINATNTKSYSSYRTTWGSGGVFDPDVNYVTNDPNAVRSFNQERTFFLSARVFW